MRDEYLFSLDFTLKHDTELFVIWSPDGILQMPFVELLEKKYPDQFRILGPSNVPTMEGLLTGKTERFCKVLRRFMGLSSWPKILIINNIESLSVDQALALHACLDSREQERDEPSDWPRSIILILKQGNFLPGDRRADLKKFVRLAIDPDAVIDDD